MRTELQQVGAVSLVGLLRLVLNRVSLPAAVPKLTEDAETIKAGDDGQAAAEAGDNQERSKKSRARRLSYVDHRSEMKVKPGGAPSTADSVDADVTCAATPEVRQASLGPLRPVMSHILTKIKLNAAAHRAFAVYGGTGRQPATRGALRTCSRRV